MMARVKTASTIIAFPGDKAVTVYNYLTKDAVTCAPNDLYWVAVVANWTSIEALIDSHPNIPRDQIEETIDTLVSTGMLVAEGSERAILDAQYNNHWELGPTSAAFHFTTLNYDFMNLDESTDAQKQKSQEKPSPVLFKRNSAASIDLTPYIGCDDSPLSKVMQKRRSRREVENEPISVSDLAGMLYAGLGIVGFVKTESAVLPLKMTPSGGARNPYEAFVWVRSVEGLQSGIYHYSALDSTLEKIKDSPNVLPSEVHKGQDWADNMSAIVFLTAYLERSSWKYSDDYAYKALLIEAGHIGQNMMLRCADNGLTACPTAALDHHAIGEMLGLKGITEFPVYSLLVGRPKPSLDIVYPASEYETLQERLALELQAF
jgi:SagB-type dehydrogenase family enzyme